MAITIDWPIKVINVPRADMLLVQSAPSEIRELDLDAFRLELKSIEASAEGMPFVDTHSHNPPVTVGGVTLARVVEIINGYTVTFEDGQYAVNLVGANSNVADITNVNQVSVRSANSAGLTYSKEIEDQSFADARIWIDDAGLPGTQFPRGTPGDPVNNIADAQAIISNRNLPKRLHIKGTFNISENLDSYDIEGASSQLTVLDFGSSSSASGTVISDAEIRGALSGSIDLSFCKIVGLDSFNGAMYDCGLSGTINLTNSMVEFISCHSDVSGSASAPIINCGDQANLDLSIRDWNGGLELTNISGSNSSVSVDINAGRLILDSSVSSGDIAVRGSGYIIDNSTGATVNISGLSFGTSGLTPEESAQLGQIDVLRKLMQNRMETNPVTGVLTIYDDDDVSIFLQGNIYEDVLATQIYRGRGLERRDRLA